VQEPGETAYSREKSDQMHQSDARWRDAMENEEEDREYHE
jgi:hypothetical protein